MNVPQSTETLLRQLEAEAPEAAFQWLNTTLRADTLDDAAFFGAYAAAGRRLGPLAELARTSLLIRVCALRSREQHVALVREVFRKGDNLERIALLRSLSVLPEPARFLETAIEACRTHVQDVFEAIACDNPFPAAHFPALNFQQLVMKALFTGAPLSQVQGWQGRVTPDLQRMAADFAAERSAAGRVVPADVALILDGGAP